MCDALRELFDELYGEKIEKQIQLEKDNAKVEGQALSVLDLLEDIGPVPSALRKTIMAQKDVETLSRWLKAAAKAGSLEQFQQEMTLQR